MLTQDLYTAVNKTSNCAELVFLKTACQYFISVSEEEFLVLAENLRSWTQRVMKIEVAPWIRDYVVDMQELYSELILQEIARKPSAKERTIIENYQVLFDLHAKGPNKILAKGEPGMGKTTWGKKIAFDWAKKNFKKFSLILLIYLKLVHPDDTLENAMIEQIPELEGLRISPSKLESFIEHFGERCLLILDGLDEHAIGSNKDVQKVLQHRKYLNCNIIVTSRPHSTAEIQGSCQTVVSVEGFTRNEAKKFASCIVRDEKAVEQILDFNPTSAKQDIVLHKCPILLSFMCILVREKAIDLSKKTMPTGEIYTRMIQCLYKKFTIRRGISYDEDEFTRVVGLVGKLAWETLLSDNPLFERSRVEREVGKDAFDYGFLIGNEDMIGDTKADIFITFPHKTIQEFFGAFGFVTLLSNRLLDLKSTKRIFLDNPLFLHFCFWFLSGRCSREYFPAVDMNTACMDLYTYLVEIIQCRVLNLRDISKNYPALNVLGSVHACDDTNAEHFGRILEMLDKVQCLTLRHDDPVDWILNHIKCTLTLIVVEDDSDESKHNVFPELLQSKGNDLNILLSGKTHSPGVMIYLLQKAAQWDRQLALYLFLTDRISVDISKFLHHQMHQLHVVGIGPVRTKVFAAGELFSTPLSHLSIIGRVALDESVMLVTAKAFREGKLSRLKNLSFACAELTGRIGHLFDRDTILSTVTNLCFYDIDKNDIETLSQNWINVTDLSINTLTKSGLRTVMKSLGQGMLKNLRKFCLSMIDSETIGLETVRPENLPQLEHLGLQRCIASKTILERLSHLLTDWTLYTLDISHSSGICGKLSILLQFTFPSLKSLILHDCKLNEKDLKTLDLANAQGRLPILEDLDLSENCHLIGNVGEMSSKWIHLKRLKLDHQPSSYVLQTGLDILGQLTRMNCIPSIQEIRLATHSADLTENKPDMQGQLKYLERLDIVPSAGGDILEVFARIYGSKKLGHFPSLQTLCVLTDNVTRDLVSEVATIFLLRFRNIGVELYLIKKDLKKLAIESGLMKDISH